MLPLIFVALIEIKLEEKLINEWISPFVDEIVDHIIENGIEINFMNPYVVVEKSEKSELGSSGDGIVRDK